MNNEDDVFGQQIDKYEPDEYDKFMIKWMGHLTYDEIQEFENDLATLCSVMFRKGMDYMKGEF